MECVGMVWPLNRRSLLVILLALPASVVGEESGIPSAVALHEESGAIRREMEARILKLDQLLDAEPVRVALYSARGDAHLFAGHFKEARLDFEKMISLDPSQDAPHWRLGIVYFLLGDYGKGAAQFQRYHAYDDHDRENGVWHFFCLAKVEGVEKARGKMLAYTRFDRHPFPSLYEMHAGKKSAAEVLKEVEEAAVEVEEKERRRFFAELYVGMEDWLQGRKKEAAGHLEKAVSNRWGREVSQKTYMWQVARLLWEEWGKALKPR